VVRRPGAERSAALEQVRALNIRCRGLGQAVRTLSGGNQQKVALGKWLATSPAVLLLDDPTRGVDVGAKHEIYELVNRWTAAGLGVVMTSSELPELLGLADDLIVMHRGVVTARLARSEATPERVIAAAMGVREEAA
jgi:ribose transport system ATP-binding protein